MKRFLALALLLPLAACGGAEQQLDWIPPQHSEKPVASDVTVHFASASAKLDSTAMAVIDAQAKILAATPALKAHLAGHADPRGSEEYNLALSDRRVEAVRKALVNAGVADARIKAHAYGEDRPQGDDLAANRIVTIVVK